MIRIAITPGEPAGIGPDLVARLAQQPSIDAELVVIADGELLNERAQELGLSLQLHSFNPQHFRPSGNGQLSLVNSPLRNPAIAGQLDPNNAAYVLHTLDAAAKLCLEGVVDAVATGPVHKGIINDAGVAFSGHTEFFAEKAGCDQVVMMLATQGLRVALVTTHLPLRDVPDAIQPQWLERCCRILQSDLVEKFGIAEPRTLVCGLNPHAGEGGHLGHEEIEVIEPVLEKLRAEGMNLQGPLPADTLFTEHNLDGADAVLAMYHDQGLPVLKHKGFGKAINITLGLPFIRTSVDHGTALDLAGTGKADVGSFHLAVITAISMAKARKNASGA